MKEETDRKQKMVGWYDPGQLFKTGIMTAISTVIGEYADPRAAGAADEKGEKFFDYSRALEVKDDDFASVETDARGEIWIDYAADVGDGWNSTYAVAYSLARESLEIEYVLSETPEENTVGEVKVYRTAPTDGDANKKTLPRGEILIFGGDGVYPTASANEYQRRLVMPYRMAFRAGEKAAGAANTAANAATAIDLKREPHVFVVPGNHDWYDSLVAFRKLFCSHIFNERKFAFHERTDANGKIIKRGGWRTRQKRSYFALKLPHDWWLLGVDLQLAHNIDLGQLEYFDAVIKKMDANSRVVLCVPEPYWVNAIKYDEFDLPQLKEKEASIQTLEKFFEAKGIKIEAYIAGDLHHYRRFEDIEQVQKITAGGGGAFLHPTHDFDFERHDSDFLENKEKPVVADDDEAEAVRRAERRKKHFFLRKSYPDLPESSRQDWKNLWFFWNNPKFGLVTAAVYPIIAWLIHGKILDGNFNFSKAAKITGNRLIDEPLAAVVIVLLLVGVGFFTDSNSKLYKWVAGTLHGAAHLTAIFFLGWLAYAASDSIIQRLCQMSEVHPTYSNLIWFLCVLVIPAVGGYLIGAMIMGLYLFVSLHLFRRHDNEAFSALKIEDYKNFLRLHINTAGDLTIYPLKINRVPRHWTKQFGETGEIKFYEPRTEIKVELIEQPIRIKSNKKPQGEK